MIEQAALALLFQIRTVESREQEAIKLPYGFMETSLTGP